MQKQGVWGLGVRTLAMAVVAGIIGLALSGTVLAVDSSSDNYQVTEWQFGNSGSSVESCSGSYCSQATIGDPDAATYSGHVDFVEVQTDEPLLEVIIEPGESNLGTLSTERTATKTTLVKVRNNYEGGYSLQITGSPPKFGDHTLATSATPTASTMGVEQFAMNLTANTTPSVGTLPVQVAKEEGSQVVFGEPTEAYRTANLFKYIDGDIIAQSTSERGRTDYTISMIINVSSATPAGNYTADFGLFIVPTL